MNLLLDGWRRCRLCLQYRLEKTGVTSKTEISAVCGESVIGILITMSPKTTKEVPPEWSENSMSVKWQLDIEPN